MTSDSSIFGEGPNGLSLRTDGSVLGGDSGMLQPLPGCDAEGITTDAASESGGRPACDRVLISSLAGSTVLTQAGMQGVMSLPEGGCAYERVSDLARLAGRFRVASCQATGECALQRTLVLINSMG